MLSRHFYLILLFIACNLIRFLGGCASLPSQEAVLRESARGSTTPKVKDAEGLYSKQEIERIVERKAGDDDDEEHLKRFVRAE
ncbi:MAG TPA: hypothetical protein VHT73_15840 [Thermodesulfobacteriota bacterium]|nr:hypothetical protein [Thermodesulfobacteriota bacterium]